MLQEITIHNLGLIDSLSLSFSSSFTILTGETGAGKSIIIDALRFSLGEKINKSFVKNPTLPSFA
ncbi:MAG: DNA repair protein RecN, partial [Candidatus Moranbacteria bacterium]|nr:DNA repair protein RecN [Candidatus Moranbacteria bacterium]